MILRAFAITSVEFSGVAIGKFADGLLGRTMKWVGSVSIVLMTIWITIQGYRIVTGQSRDSMAALVMNSLKATLIVGIATAWGVGAGSSIFDWMGDGLQKNITEVVTGSTRDAYENIDRSLGYMQLAFTSIDSLQDGESTTANDQKTRALWFTGIGTGGPAITAGVMLLLNKIALALFTGLGPIFILCLLFEQTKQLFGKWLFYGIGTMFSLAVLSVMVGIALDVVTAVAASFWVTSFIGGSNEGVSSMALQQGGLGLVLTMLIISAPPMAASFFQGTMGQFYASSWFGGGTGSQPGARVGESGYRGGSTQAAANNVPVNQQGVGGTTSSGQYNPQLGQERQANTFQTDTTRAIDQSARGAAANPVAPTLSNPNGPNVNPSFTNANSPTPSAPPSAGKPPSGGTS